MGATPALDVADMSDESLIERMVDLSLHGLDLVGRGTWTVDQFGWQFSDAYQEVIRRDLEDHPSIRFGGMAMAEKMIEILEEMGEDPS